MKKEFLMAGVTVILWSTLPAVSKLIISQLDGDCEIKSVN